MKRKLKLSKVGHVFYVRGLNSFLHTAICIDSLPLKSFWKCTSAKKEWVNDLCKYKSLHSFFQRKFSSKGLHWKNINKK